MTKYVAVFALTCSAAFSQPPQEIRFNGGRQDRAGLVVTDASANMYIGGSVEANSKASTFAVLKYSASGAHQWTAHLSALPDEFSGFAASIAVDAAGNTYAAGNILRRVGNFGTKVDWVVASFSPSGSQRWAHRFKGPADNSFASARSILASASGELYVSGISGTGQADWKIIKYSAAGAVLWQADIAGAVDGDDGPTQIAFDPAGNLVVAGNTTNVAFTLRHDITVARFSPDGMLLWRRDFSDTELADDLTSGLAIDIGGNIYVSGFTALGPEERQDTVFVKWDSNGNRIFAKKSGAVAGGAIAIDGAGDIVTSGATFDAATFSSEFAVSKLDSDGNLRWTVPLTSAGHVATDFARNIYVAGSTINLGSSDQADFFAAKLTPAGVPVWQHRHTAGLRVSSAALDILGNWIVTGSGATGPASFQDDILTLKFPASFTSPPPAAPFAPGGLNAAASSRQIELTWNDLSSNEDGFQIERCQGRGCTNFVQIAQTPANTRAFVNTGLARRTDYSYRVRAFNASGNSAYSNTASARTGN